MMVMVTIHRFFIVFSSFFNASFIAFHRIPAKPP